MEKWHHTHVISTGLRGHKKCKDILSNYNCEEMTYYYTQYLEKQYFHWMCSSPARSDDTVSAAHRQIYYCGTQTTFVYNWAAVHHHSQTGPQVFKLLQKPEKKNPVQFHSTSHRKHWVDHIFHKLVMMMSCTYVHSERAGVWADVSAGESERFAAHLTEAPHERMIWDTNPYELQDQIIMKHKCVHETEDVMKSTTLTLVKGLRSLLREADLSRTSVTGPGSRSLNSSSFTDTLQKLKT